MRRSPSASSAEEWTGVTESGGEESLLLLESIAWFLDHPLCRVTGPTVVCESLQTATAMALPMPSLPRRTRKKAPSQPFAAAVAQWLEETLLGGGQEETSPETTPRGLWLRHVDPLLQRSLEAAEVRSAPMLRFSVEPETLFESRGLLWAKARSCGDPTPVWLLVGARLVLPKAAEGIETLLLLAVDSLPVTEFAQRVLPDGGRLRRV